MIDIENVRQLTIDALEDSAVEFEIKQTDSNILGACREGKNSVRGYWLQGAKTEGQRRYLFQHYRDLGFSCEGTPEKTTISW